MGCISCCFQRFLTVILFDIEKKDIIEEARTTFEFLDTDNDKIITLEGVSDNWNGKYGKTFASIIFREVDNNRDNRITKL